MASVTEDEMRSAIEQKSMEGLIESPAVFSKCCILCSKYAESISEFLEKLDAFVMNTDGSKLTLELIGSFEQSLYKDSVTQRIATAGVLKDVNFQKNHNSPDAVTLGKRSTSELKTPNLDSRVAKVAAKTPGATATKAAAYGGTGTGGAGALEAGLSQGNAVAYSKRPNMGQTVQTFNPGLGGRGEFEASDVKPLGMRCRLRINPQDFDNITNRYRFMFTTLEERARALDRHLLKLQSQLCKFASIPEDELHPVGSPSQDTVWVCGRICCEAAQGRINKSSVVLEGSRRDSGGRRVKLELQDLSSYSLFPGQVVLVEGVNSSGRKMVAKKILEGIPPPIQTSSATKLLEYHHSTYYQGGSPLSIITAAGPFTTSDNLDYQPLQDLLVNVLQTKPDVLILVGPFVDVSQSLLKTGDVQLRNNYDDDDEENEGAPAAAHETHGASYEMVFVEKVIRDCIQSMFDSEADFGGPLPTNIVLVPSLLDAHHEFVFPQPPFGDRDRVQTSYFEEDLGILSVPFSREGDPRKRVHLMPNPCMFRINEVLIGVCSNDVLFSLTSDEVSMNIEGNRLARLAGHLLQQQSFCPQFPAPQNVLAQYDLRHARHWEFDSRPDVMVLPSRLAALAKDVFGTLVVNPGPLTRGVGGGTYAQMDIHPHKEGDLRAAILKHNQQQQQQQQHSGLDKDTAASESGSDFVPHMVSARTSVTIRKI